METSWYNGFEQSFERSTSAPPSEASFDVLGKHDLSSRPLPHGKDMRNGSQFDSIFGTRSSDPVNRIFHENGSSLEAPKSSVASSFNKAPPGFGSSTLFSRTGVPDRAIGRMNRRSGAGVSDNASIGESIIRSHSAAPSVDLGLHLGPPPGLATSETPLVSNISKNTGRFIDDVVVDRSHVLLAGGQRRPSSTGVIGQNISSSSAVLKSLGLGPGVDARPSAVRPAAKTLMDLIQEDFPPESTSPADGYNDNPLRENSNIYIDRPRTTSPLSVQTRDNYYERGIDPFAQSTSFDPTAQRPMESNPDAKQVETPNTIHEAFPMNGASDPAAFRYGSQDSHGALRPTFVSLNGVNGGTPRAGDTSSQGTSGFRVRPLEPPRVAATPAYIHHHQSQPMDQHSVYTNMPPPVQPLQVQILPSGQAVYLNTSPYGYATIQYSAPSPQHHMMHQHVAPSMTPDGQHYISVMPVQAPAQHIQSHGPTYTYYGQFNDPNASQAPPVPVMSAQGGSPVVMGSQPPGRMSPPESHQQVHGRGANGNVVRGKDKTPRSKKNGVSPRKPPGSSSKSPSAILEEFRSKKSREWTMKRIEGHIVEFCQDQNGSRFVQHRLEVGNPDEMSALFAEVLPATRKLRNDVFGNYVVQKLLDFGTDEAKMQIFETLRGEVVPLSFQMYGCRVVQKALETLELDCVLQLLEEFHGKVIACIHDQNGNHVIQKCVEVLSLRSKAAEEDGDREKSSFLRDCIDFIINDVLGSVQALSCHPYGCRVFQRLLEYCEEPRKGRVLDAIMLVHRPLLGDQYGNYVIQHVLQHGRLEDRDSVLLLIAENGLLELSRQKFASNVIEKLLKYGAAQQRKAVVREMLKPLPHADHSESSGRPHTSVVMMMVRDAYANYVVQTALDVVPECEEKRLLTKELKAHLSDLRNYTYAKQIVARLGA